MTRFERQMKNFLTLLQIRANNGDRLAAILLQKLLARLQPTRH